ncbi:MAG TPA: ribosome silencing factor [Gammaproteobacteria bacterium]|jgi:ribosome-associated protein|nr:ribosome silencing factor [Gammaproteobacteria bacterium]
MNVELAPEALRDLVTVSLDDGKAENICVIDVSALTTITDYMVIASGRSSRQVKALTARVVEAARDRGVKPIGIEGETTGEWVLIDFGDVIVHTMQPETRAFYQLEKLWDQRPANPDRMEITWES